MVFSLFIKLGLKLGRKSDVYLENASENYKISHENFKLITKYPFEVSGLANILTV